jgi:hypothetical protein
MLAPGRWIMMMGGARAGRDGHDGGPSGTRGAGWAGRGRSCVEQVVASGRS